MAYSPRRSLPSRNTRRASESKERDGEQAAGLRDCLLSKLAVWRTSYRHQIYWDAEPCRSQSARPILPRTRPIRARFRTPGPEADLGPSAVHPAGQLAGRHGGAPGIGCRPGWAAVPWARPRRLPNATDQGAATRRYCEEWRGGSRRACRKPAPRPGHAGRKVIGFAPSHSTDRPITARRSRPPVIVSTWFPASGPALEPKEVGP